MERRDYKKETSLPYRMLQIAVCIWKGFQWRILYTCDIDLRDLPKSTFFPHPLGIVIRGGTKIGENCRIQQNVTIGSRRDTDGLITIGNNVFIGAGAIIIGELTIGDNAVIAARSLVLKDVPANTTYLEPISSELRKNEGE